MRSGTPAHGRRERENGKMHGICHVEILSTDVAATKGFVNGLFGWEVWDMSPDYAFFKTEDGLGGGVERAEGPLSSGDIRIYIHVESIEETLEKARELGARVEKGKTEIGGDHGFYAQIEAPGGAILGLWQASEE
jgi:predicted enzyme related to lactoylglutathione lyase